MKRKILFIVGIFLCGILCTPADARFTGITFFNLQPPPGQDNHNEAVLSDKEQLLQNARKYLPHGEQRERLIEELRQQEDDFDPAVNLIRRYRGPGANRYHSEMVDTVVHPLRQSANYASDLMDTGISEFKQRAFSIFEEIIKHQDQNESSETYGIWPYHYEESLEQMNRPDWNWADFIGVPMLETYMKHYETLPGELKKKMEASLIHASRSIQERDVKPGYTNIAIMGTLVTWLTSHLFDLPEMKAYARMRLRRFYEYTVKLGGFAEYNSPTYTRVALDELQRMRQYILDPEAKKLINFCYAVGWEVLASHFHPPTGQLAAPNSRSYSTLLRDYFYDFLYGASGGKVRYHNAILPAEYYKLKHQIPETMVSNFLQLETERVEVDTFSLGNNPVIGYTWLHPQYTVGTANRSTTWQQRRPFVAYWGSVEQPRYLQPKLLHDFVEFAAGNIFSVQDKNRVITALNFATNGGDYHISIDRLKEGRFKAKDLRLRFEFGDAGLFSAIELEGRNLINVEDGDIRLQLQLLHAVFGHKITKIEKGKDDQTCWIDLIIYSGEERDFKLSEVTHAAFAWATSITSDDEQEEVPVEAVAVLKKKRLNIKWDKMKLSVPVQPHTEQYLQQNFSYE